MRKTDRELVIETLIRRGNDQEYAEHVADHEQRSLTYALARLDGATYELHQAFLNAIRRQR